MRFKTLARITIFVLGILVAPLLTKFLVAPISFHEPPGHCDTWRGNAKYSSTEEGVQF